MQKIRVNIGTVISIILGIVIIVIGYKVYDGKIDLSSTATHTALRKDIPSASFGGDFYTYMYDASDTIVTELSDIDSGIETTTQMIYTLNQNLYKTANEINKTFGLLIICIGIATIAIAIPKLIVEPKQVISDTPANKVTAKDDLPTL